MKIQPISIVDGIPISVNVDYLPGGLTHFARNQEDKDMINL
ncbi:hypothetical protein [Cylindrospermopsis curvispora]|nr:hypothetical protein [Cylindrospermopsis curvispora]